MWAKNIGIDIGYGFVKATDGARDLVFPSVVGVGQDLTYLSELTLYVAEEDNLIVEYDGARYFVGGLAIRQSEMALRSLVENRPGDVNARVLFATAMGLMANGSEQARFNVVTGLPPSHYLSYKDDLARVLAGTHKVAFIRGPKRVERTITVDHVRVVPQPFGTVFHLLLDNAGNIAGKELAHARIGIIDIGFRTSDFVVADKLEYIDRLSFSSTTALGTAYSLISDELRRQHRISRESYELDSAVVEGRIRVAGKVHDITEIRDAAFRKVAAKVITEINSVWDKHGLDLIYVTGGGGQALYPYLKQEYENAQLVDTAQAANAKGYWKLAQKLYKAAGGVPGGNSSQEFPAAAMHPQSVQPVAGKR